jgi:uncharacterized RDD family membrane protein YckC
MNCPACRRGLPAGHNDRCPFCEARLSGPSEGALATDPALDPTPNPRDPQPPIREIPGLRKRERERTWKDEVRERVRDRREQRSADLPLFPAEAEAEGEVDGEAIEDVDPLEESAGAAGEALPEVDVDSVLGLGLGLGPGLEPETSGPRELGDPDRDDLLLDAALGTAEPPPVAEAPPVERPALPIERLMAGLVDLAVLVAMGAAVVYFSSRVARVPLSGLQPAWPWLAAYLGALGLLYAGYFTGTTGQTLGKMAHRLHVLHLSGGPPGHARAVARALLGSLGVLLAGGGLVPMLFDPARRALHDRLLRTRVIRL